MAVGVNKPDSATRSKGGASRNRPPAPSATPSLPCAYMTPGRAGALLDSATRRQRAADTWTQTRFIQSQHNERGGPRARPRYPGKEEEEEEEKEEDEEEEEEKEGGLFKADAVNEEDPERDKR